MDRWKLLKLFLFFVWFEQNLNRSSEVVTLESKMISLAALVKNYCSNYFNKTILTIPSESSQSFK